MSGNLMGSVGARYEEPDAPLLQRESRVHSALEAQRTLITELHNQMGDLYDRLTPVLSEIGLVEKDSDPAMPSTASKLAAQLFNNNQGLIELQKRISELMTRLDV